MVLGGGVVRVGRVVTVGGIKRVARAIRAALPAHQCLIFVQVTCGRLGRRNPSPRNDLRIGTEVAGA